MKAPPVQRPPSLGGRLKNALTRERPEAHLYRVIFVGLVFIAGYVAAVVRQPRVLAMEWSENSKMSSPQLTLGAIVKAVPSSGGYDIHAEVLMDSSYLFGWFSRQHDAGTIGHAKSLEEAATKWGKIEWRQDGLHIGSFFLDRGTIERDR